MSSSSLFNRDYIPSLASRSHNSKSLLTGFNFTPGQSTGSGLLRIRLQWKVFRPRANQSTRRTTYRKYYPISPLRVTLKYVSKLIFLPPIFLFRPGGIPARSEKGERLLLFIGIIDILQSYRLRKKLEHTWKSIIHDGVSFSSFFL